MCSFSLSSIIYYEIIMYILSGRNENTYLINKITLYILSGRNKNTLYLLRIYFEYIIIYLEKIYKFLEI
jgi:hypothetical protein